MTKDDINTEEWHRANFERVGRGEKPQSYFQWWIDRKWGGWGSIAVIVALIIFYFWSQERKKKVG